MAKRKSNKDRFARFMERVQQPVPLGPKLIDEVSNRDLPKSLDEISTRDLLHMRAGPLGNQSLGLSPRGTILQHLLPREYRAAGGANHA